MWPSRQRLSHDAPSAEGRTALSSIDRARMPFMVLRVVGQCSTRLLVYIFLRFLYVADIQEVSPQFESIGTLWGMLKES
jgi:hypothetical protein